MLKKYLRQLLSKNQQQTTKRSRSAQPFGNFSLFISLLQPLKHWLKRTKKSFIYIWYQLQRRSRLTQSGYVLPMTALLLLVMSLVVGSTLYRSTVRTMEVAAEQRQQVVYNSATPAIDRAKAKLEYLFQQDPRLPGGLPSDGMLESIVLNNGKYGVPKLDQDPSKNGVQNPYLLPDETAIDLDDDGRPDAAWTFPMDTDGDGNDETIAYSIYTRTSNNGVDRTDQDQEKAKNLVVRNGPINLTSLNNANCDDNLAPDLGWDPVNSATVRRAFQVTALVISNDQSATKSVSTLEMQQDRQASRGNRWGAWIRNDLEIFPGPGFFWNGAIHTEGNLMIGGNNFRSYLISSPASCLYSRDNSEITITGAADGTTPPFQGQMLVGRMNDNRYAGRTSVDLFAADGNVQNVPITSANDSVSNGAGNPANLSIDPVIVFTENRNQARSGNPNNQGVRDRDWEDQNVVTEGRIFNRSARAPYIDDTYRADDRYGPKPAYNDVIAPFIDDQGNPTGKKVGQQISTKDPNYGALTNSDPSQVDTLGLDGYWERRAWAEGLRVIVGQRLELGNTNGWRRNDDPDYQEPLYPPLPNQPQARENRDHEQKQWKSLRDNLAAVQSTAVYHSASRNRNFPIACLATTAHPGTATTISNSITFGRDDSGNIVTDFLTGNGTNGWEFAPPQGNETDFVKAITDQDHPLRIALDNLAHFAGDGAPENSPDFNSQAMNYGHYGAFPPLQEDGGTQIHPEPMLSMWGNFSDLRRSMHLLEEDGYNRLSIADKTTIQTAACTVGMLAYDLEREKELYENPLKDSSINWTNLGVHMYSLFAKDGTITNGSPIIGRPQPGSKNFEEGLCKEKDSSIPDYDDPNWTGCPTKNPNGGKNKSLNIDDPEHPVNYFAHFSSEEWITALKNSTSVNSQEEKALRTLSNTGGNNNKYLQVLRDRRLGFNNGSILSGDIDGDGDFDSKKGIWTNTGTNLVTANGVEENDQLPMRCDPQFFNKGNIKTNKKAKVSLAMSVCSTTDLQPKYPALYYIFPTNDHDQIGTNNTITEDDQLDTEPYIDEDYISDINPTSGVDTYIYRALDDDEIKQIAIQPRQRSDWRTPITTDTSDRVNIITDDGTNVGVGFLDKGIFNGREMMGVRVLDFDLDMLRNSQTFMGVGSQSWFPDSGVIYAFREDAIREDAIARPRNATWSNCNTATEIVNANCRMDAVDNNPQDPPVNNITGISPKPVDFYADPDRRPHGFRLRNGEDLRRIPDPPNDFALRGLAFISDNPVYIQADNASFNLHNSTTSGNRIEEFEETLNNNWSNFYQRRTLNREYGRSGDTWRPAEIIADAVTLLSGDFVDGNIAQGIRRQDIPSRSSYRTLNAPNNNGADYQWRREDGSQTNDVNDPSPIIIDRNGFPLYRENSANEFRTYSIGDGRRFRRFNENKWQIDVNEGDQTRINATIVSGLIPSRAQQSYGGLHNFPRFIERWRGEDLHIAGAFVQLNFSTYGTAPFDQDSWEPGNNAQAQELIRYYSPPPRRWGYDVGLQYAPAGPVATRFVVPGNTRSEFYQELPLDDPYVLKLRCAEILPGVKIDQDVSPDLCKGV